MKILTLNTHSLQEDNYLQKLDQFVEGILREKPGIIDGWPETPESALPEGIRLDYIWCSRKAEIQSSRTIFTGTGEPVVSDHFGILVETF